MKQTLQHTANLRATFSGGNDSMPFSELLSSLGRSSASGILLATTGGQRFEVRLASGLVVEAPAASEIAALIEDEGAAWSFRATAGAPEGSQRLAADDLLLAAAFAMQR